jgi:hypothetical protein
LESGRSGTFKSFILQCVDIKEDHETSLRIVTTPDMKVQPYSNTVLLGETQYKQILAHIHEQRRKYLVIFHAVEGRLSYTVASSNQNSYVQ